MGIINANAKRPKMIKRPTFNNFLIECVCFMYQPNLCKISIYNVNK